MIENKESMTAKLCAFARAFYSSANQTSPNNDYLAKELLGRHEYASIHEMIKTGQCPGICPSYNHHCNVHDTVCKYLAPIPISRDIFASEKFDEFSKKHGNCQYIICGAGLDTFSFRNQNENIEVFEIDHPSTQRFKLERIKQLDWKFNRNIHFVSVDFSKDNMMHNLIENGYNPYQPAFFVILGLTYYLTIEQIRSLVEKISAVAWAPSALILDYPNKDIHIGERVRRLSKMTENLGEKMTGDFDVDDFISILNMTEYYYIEHYTPSDIQKNYLNGQTNLTAFENIHFIYAEKQHTQDHQ